MIAAPLRADEDAALLALQALQVLDSEPEAEFDALVNAAALACGTPISMLSLIDSQRQWFKAKVGLPGVAETPREQAFCAHAVLQDTLLEVPDATLDPRFVHSPLVTGEPQIRFYAGAPLCLSDGLRVGTLCVMDHQARELLPQQRALLLQLAIVAVRALETRRGAAAAQAKAQTQAQAQAQAQAQTQTQTQTQTLGYLGAVEDATARKQLEVFLDRTGRLARVGGWAVDLRSQVLSWSAQTRRIHEVDDNYVPKVDSAILFYEPAARPLITAAVEQGMAEGRPWDLELPLVTALGRKIWVRALGDAELEDGRPVRLVGAFQDVTEQRLRRQERLQEQSLRSKLEQQVRDTERLLRERDETLDVMAHEVRQPLNNASAALQSALRVLSAVNDPSVAPPLLRAQAVLAQVLAGIDNTLAVAALLARAGPIEPQDADIDALLQVVLADLPQAQRERVQIDRHTRTRTASMDMSLMRLALRNLLSNALKYSPERSPVAILISDSDEPLALLFDVVDQGSGIAMAQLPRLFERHMHRGQPRRHAEQGLGLGLYIVKRVMELHGGSVSLRVNSPRGLTMRLVVNQPVGD